MATPTGHSTAHVHVHVHRTCSTQLSAKVATLWQRGRLFSMTRGAGPPLCSSYRPAPLSGLRSCYAILLQPCWQPSHQTIRYWSARSTTAPRRWRCARSVACRRGAGRGALMRVRLCVLSRGRGATASRARIHLCSSTRGPAPLALSRDRLALMGRTRPHSRSRSRAGRGRRRRCCRSVAS